MPRAKSNQRPITDEVIRERIFALAEKGPIHWGHLPLGRYTEQAGYLVGEGLMQIITINGAAHVARRLDAEVNRS